MKSTRECACARVSPCPLSSLWQQPSCVQLVRVCGAACFPSSFPIQEERLRLLAELSPPMGAQLGTSHPNQGGTRHLPNRAFIQVHHIRVNQTLGEQKVSFRSGRSGQSEAQRRKMRANSRRAGGSLCLAGASWPPSLPSQRKHLIRQLGLRCVLFTQEGKVSLEVVYQLYGFDICKRLQECHVHRQSPVSSSGLLNISACRQ